MAQFQGTYGSEEARSYYQARDLKQNWTNYQNYVNMDPERRAAIDAALGGIVNSGSQAAIDELVRLHPEMEDPRNAATMARYFNTRGIHPPYDRAKLTFAFQELDADSLIEPLDEVESKD